MGDTLRNTYWVSVLRVSDDGTGTGTGLDFLKIDRGLIKSGELSLQCRHSSLTARLKPSFRRGWGREEIMGRLILKESKNWSEAHPKLPISSFAIDVTVANASRFGTRYLVCPVGRPMLDVWGDRRVSHHIFRMS